MDRGQSTSLAETLKRLNAPMPDFWENEVEMGLENIQVRCAHNDFTEDWIDCRTGRQVAILCRNLQLDGADSVQKKRAAVKERHRDLLPFILAENFCRNKSKVAIVEFAKGVLERETVSASQINDQKFDTIALLFAIYNRQPQDLRLIFHLDKIHKSGFARMALKETVRKPKQSFQAFLQPPNVTKILAAFDKAQGDGRTSELKDVVSHDGRPLVFIRRAEHPDLILRQGKIIHGYRPEWIILDFADNAKTVNISSVSVSIPLEIANRVASSYFGRSCEYENESTITYSKQILRFLKTLVDTETDDLKLVEIVVVNSPLETAPKLKVIHSDSHSIGEALRHFEKAVGTILEDVDHLESVKVDYRHKRITLIFEKQEGKEDEYVIRYSDHRLNAFERKQFEEFLGETYEITVLSTEKRFKR
ncbi:MAG: hypothetical protein A3J28_18160 [Acidobacteria bacterium RIFCSPLOWO2_12_FULL_60_22]|nr:MAG: hypothetical protein A3J28_18160 [Acidobacteria bacterium RIFCSPLOWO2_12_FULL_60_22]